MTKDVLLDQLVEELKSVNKAQDSCLEALKKVNEELRLIIKALSGKTDGNAWLFSKGWKRISDVGGFYRPGTQESQTRIGAIRLQLAEDGTLDKD